MAVKLLQQLLQPQTAMRGAALLHIAVFFREQTTLSHANYGQGKDQAQR